MGRSRICACRGTGTPARSERRRGRAAVSGSRVPRPSASATSAHFLDPSYARGRVERPGLGAAAVPRQPRCSCGPIRVLEISSVSARPIKVTSSSRSKPIRSGIRGGCSAISSSGVFGSTTPPTHGCVSKKPIAASRARNSASGDCERRHAATSVAPSQPARADISDPRCSASGMSPSTPVMPHHAAPCTDGPRDQPPRERRGHQRRCVERPGRRAEQRDAPGIAAEGGDVVVHPAKRLDLVEHAVLARRPAALRAQRGMPDEAENAQPIGDRHDNHPTPDERRRVVVGLPDRVRAGVQVHHHRHAARRRGAARREHVQVEAVLAAVRAGDAPPARRPAARSAGRTSWRCARRSTTGPARAAASAGHRPAGARTATPRHSSAAPSCTPRSFPFAVFATWAPAVPGASNSATLASTVDIANDTRIAVTFRRADRFSATRGRGSSGPRRRAARRCRARPASGRGSTASRPRRRPPRAADGGSRRGS